MTDKQKLDICLRYLKKWMDYESFDMTDDDISECLREIGETKIIYDHFQKIKKRDEELFGKHGT